MSEQNVEVVRQGWKAFLEGGIDAALDFFAEDCVYEDWPDSPDRRSYEGREGLRQRTANFAGIWGNDLVYEPVEFIDAGEDGVVTVTSVRGHGRASGVPIDAQIAFVHEVRDGKIVRDRAFTARSQALKAAGLSE